MNRVLLFLFVVFLFSCVKETTNPKPEEEEELTEFELTGFDISMKEWLSPRSRTLIGHIKNSNKDIPVIYDMDSISHPGYLMVFPGTGSIYTNFGVELDFEKTPVIRGVISGKYNSVVKKVPFSIQLTNIADEFTFDSDTFIVEENPKKGDLIAKLFATSDNPPITYKSTYTDFPGAFTVLGNGELRVEDPSFFNFEKHSILSLRVEAKDGHRTLSRFFYVKIKDTNDPLSPQEKLNSGKNPVQLLKGKEASYKDLIGLEFQGGKIFHIDLNTNRTYVVLLRNETQYWTGTNWTTCDLEYIGMKDTSMGGGISNTYKYFGTCRYGAALHCMNLEYSEAQGYTDWFMGSLNETKAAYDNLSKIETNAYSTGLLLSSSEISDSTVYAIDMDNGGKVVETHKYTRSKLSPIRMIKTN